MKREGIYQPKKVLQLCLELASDKSGSKPQGRGRPPLYSDEHYIALLAFRSFFNLAFRTTVAFFKDLFPEKACPSFQAWHWFSKKQTLPKTAFAPFTPFYTFFLKGET